jgi:hypothetical protein
MFLWTSADMIAWNDVLLEMNTPVSQGQAEPAVAS